MAHSAQDSQHTRHVEGVEQGTLALSLPSPWYCEVLNSKENLPAGLVAFIGVIRGAVS